MTFLYVYDKIRTSNRGAAEHQYPSRQEKRANVFCILPREDGKGIAAEAQIFALALGLRENTRTTVTVREELS